MAGYRAGNSMVLGQGEFQSQTVWIAETRVGRAHGRASNSPVGVSEEVHSTPSGLWIFDAVTPDFIGGY